MPEADRVIVTTVTWTSTRAHMGWVAVVFNSIRQFSGRKLIKKTKQIKELGGFSPVSNRWLGWPHPLENRALGSRKNSNLCSVLTPRARSSPSEGVRVSRTLFGSRLEEQ